MKFEADARIDYRINKLPQGRRAVVRIVSPPRSKIGQLIYALLSALSGILQTIRLRDAINPIIRFLFSKICKNDVVRIKIGENAILDIPMSDPYWMSVVLSGTYETEVQNFLTLLPVKKTLFIDGGANIGWWSLFAKSELSWTVRSVEAAPHLLIRLRDNVLQNSLDIDIVPRAIWNQSGQYLGFKSSELSHAGGHLATVNAFVAEDRLEITDSVETITVDDLTENFRSHFANGQLVIKLDVEGAEAQAFQGASASIAFGAIMIYEDHGSDACCRASAAAFEAGCVVYMLSETGFTVCESLNVVAQRKKNQSRGFNFIAVKREKAGLLKSMLLSSS